MQIHFSSLKLADHPRESRHDRSRNACTRTCSKSLKAEPAESTNPRGIAYPPHTVPPSLSFKANIPPAANPCDSCRPEKFARRDSARSKRREDIPGDIISRLPSRQGYFQSLPILCIKDRGRAGAGSCRQGK